MKVFAPTELLRGGCIALAGIYMTICGSLLAYKGASISEKLPACLIIALGYFLCRQGIRRTRLAFLPLNKASVTEGEVQQSIEDRLDELERLKRRDMVTPEEYAAKRQEILKDL
jgi:hypothetical protein